MGLLKLIFNLTKMEKRWKNQEAQKQRLKAEMMQPVPQALVALPEPEDQESPEEEGSGPEVSLLDFSSIGSGKKEPPGNCPKCGKRLLGAWTCSRCRHRLKRGRG